ncbi:class I SAM-dependent methyltransferase [Actinocatenispora rupis]|uniref:Methyltransferase domain-containing protein n=1 Tax=Actinocatenispora rupis TaxID=519421 RepID=A0A8J3NF85_9ACTN|nr:class I SAM-dependent methyltransferase [Actinocatenispora rupis]GID14630.1 hypothetical protein Aru02nite_55190 [Actinocatenispora rupis]
MSDDHVVVAEFADLFRAAGPPDRLLDALPGVLAALDVRGTVVDLGAGTGHGVLALAEAFPDSAVVAVERSAAMRTVLTSRLAYRPDLRGRVTVLRGDVFDVEQPGPWGAALAIHLVCQLDHDHRRRLWRLLADHLTDDAVAVLDRHYGVDRPRTVPLRLSATVRLGDCEYQRWYASDVAGPDRMRWHNVYRVLRGGVVLAEHDVHGQVWAADEPTILAETADAGLRHEFRDDFVLLRRAG